MSSMLTAGLGGAVIGLAATTYWVANGRIAGVSGVLGQALSGRRGRAEAVAFLSGLIASGAMFASARPAELTGDRPFGALVLAGLLVGFGTRVARGCTSGHGVCGLSRFSPRSLVATLVFMAAAAATVFLLAQLAPGMSVR
jgi:uncharacterized membrane protein YedE/YeeE